MYKQWIEIIHQKYFKVYLEWGKMNDYRNKIRIAIMVPVLYLAIVCTVGRFKNPDLTDTQLFLNFFNFVTWNFDSKDMNR